MLISNLTFDCCSNSFLSFAELFSRKERESISDHEARSEVINNLKKMIRSWINDTFPLMEEQEKISRAERMDISLIEQMKEENMKTIYEINSVVRMSFIEMQFILIIQKI